MKPKQGEMGHFSAKNSQNQAKLMGNAVKAGEVIIKDSPGGGRKFRNHLWVSAARQQRVLELFATFYIESVQIQIRFCHMKTGKKAADIGNRAYTLIRPFYTIGSGPMLIPLTIAPDLCY